METAAFIDWLSVTHFGSAEVAHHEALPNKNDVTTAHNGYTRAIKYSTGVLEMWCPERPKMGRHFIYSGKTLEHIQRAYHVTRDEILRFHTTLQGRISRCDFAIDVIGGRLDIDYCWNELEDGKANTKAAYSRTQNGQKRGYTLYIGSRKKRTKMLRIYDKAKEMGDFVSDYIRVELETRANVARNAIRIYQDNDYSPETITGMVLGFCDFGEYPLWQRALHAPPLKVPVGTHQTGATEKWLLNQCAPALAKVLLYNPSFADTFSAVVRHYVEEATD